MYGTRKWRYKIGHLYGLARKRQDEHGRQVAALRGLIVQLWPFGGRHRSAFRLALGLLAVAEETGSMTFGVSHRRLAEVSGVGGVCNTAYATGTDVKAVTTAAKVLVALGFATIEREKASKATQAQTRYHLASPDRLRQALMHHSSHPTCTSYGWSKVGTLVHSTKTLLHVAWEEAGLGVTACRVWHLLRWTDDAHSIEAMAETLRIGRNTAARAVHLLDEHYLAEQADGPRGPWRALDRNLDDVADEFGLLHREALRCWLNAKRRRSRRLALDARAREWRRNRPPLAPFHVDVETGEILAAAV